MEKCHNTEYIHVTHFYMFILYRMMSIIRKLWFSWRVSEGEWDNKRALSIEYLVLAKMYFKIIILI